MNHLSFSVFPSPCPHLLLPAGGDGGRAEAEVMWRRRGGIRLWPRCRRTHPTSRFLLPPPHLFRLLEPSLNNTSLKFRNAVLSTTSTSRLPRTWPHKIFCPFFCFDVDEKTFLEHTRKTDIFFFKHTGAKSVPFGTLN